MVKFLILTVVILLSGCKGVRQDMSHFKSRVFGIQRKATLYDASGSPIREWAGKLNVEVNGSTARFLTDDGKVVLISGTFVVEEMDKNEKRD